MDARIRREIRAIAADVRSSATELLSRGLEILRAAAEAGRDPLAEAATELVRAQPAMAGLRTAGAIALRAPAQIARHAVNLMALRTTSGPLHLVTCSKSRPVEETIRLAAREYELLVSCAESRPAKEGRELARALAEAQIPVDLYTDAGICTVVAGADAVVVGADAICRTAFINKVGTSALCALATATGTPAYVLVGREKILPDDVFGLLALRPGRPHEVARDVGSGVQVRNPYFEVVPLNLISAAVTDVGVLQANEVGQSALWR